MIGDGPLDTLRAQLETMSAAEAADLFVSPHVRGELLLKATEEPGPSMWIVNRSDVYDPTLEVLAHHAIPEVAARAKEKFKMRHHSLSLLEPPDLEGPVEEVPDYAVEDVLGHPLCPFEAMLFFSKAISEDHRASSALSLTRRLLEHAPNWSDHLGLKAALTDRFGQLLLEDHSPFVRAYAARIPLLTADVLAQATRNETHPLVLGRLFQNPQSSVEQIATWKGFEKVPQNSMGWFPLRVASLDGRLPPDLRRKLLQQAEADPLSAAIGEWYVENLH